MAGRIRKVIGPAGIRLKPGKKQTRKVKLSGWSRRAALLILVGAVILGFSWHRGSARRLLQAGRALETHARATLVNASRRVGFAPKPTTTAPGTPGPTGAPPQFLVGISPALYLKTLHIPAGAPTCSVTQGVLHLKDGAYTVKDGWLLRGDTAVGAMAAVSRTPADSRQIVSLPFDYVDARRHFTGGNLLSIGMPWLEGSILLVNDRWWAFASGAWVCVGKPVSGHTYPGFELNGGGRLTDAVNALMKLFKTDRRHKVKASAARGINPRLISAQDVETLQRIADAETGGQAAGISTYDSQVVSFGVSQWTLGSGRLQDLIRDNAPQFARYGIAVTGGEGWSHDPARCWTIAGSTVPRIVGVQNPADLTGPYWTARFFRASLDPAIITACVKLAVKELNQGWGPGRGLDYAMRTIPALRGSSRARGLLAELQNNRPAYVDGVIMATANAIRNIPALSEDDLLIILMQNIAKPYINEFARKSGALPGSALDASGREAAGERFAAKIMADVLHIDAAAVQRILASTPAAPPSPAPVSMAAQPAAPPEVEAQTVTTTVRTTIPTPGAAAGGLVHRQEMGGRLRPPAQSELRTGRSHADGRVMPRPGAAADGQANATNGLKFGATGVPGPAR